jgi:hypothetical protein
MATPTIYKTNNSILNISAFKVASSSLSNSFGLSSGNSYLIDKIEYDPLGRGKTDIGSPNRIEKSLKTLISDELMILNNSSYKYDIYVPTDSITISDESTWDYFDIYDQNAFFADRYIYSKTGIRDIKISGKYVTNSVADASLSDNKIINGSKYIMKYFLSSDMQNYCKNTLKYQLLMTEEDSTYHNLGLFFVPVSWSTSIPAKDFSDATWSINFIGPSPGFDNPTYRRPDTLYNPDLYYQHAYRNINTRDFLCKPYNKNGILCNRYIIGLDYSIYIDWEKLPTKGSYRDSKKSLPCPYFWSMKDQKGRISINEMYLTPTTSNKRIVGSYKTSDQINVNNSIISKIEVMNTEYFGTEKLVIDKIYWTDSRIEFKTDTFVVISRNGFFHNISSGTPYVE